MNIYLVSFTVDIHPNTHSARRSSRALAGFYVKAKSKAVAVKALHNLMYSQYTNRSFQILSVERCEDDLGDYEIGESGIVL